MKNFNPQHLNKFSKPLVPPVHTNTRGTIHSETFFIQLCLASQTQSNRNAIDSALVCPSQNHHKHTAKSQRPPSSQPKRQGDHRQIFYLESPCFKKSCTAHAHHPKLNSSSPPFIRVSWHATMVVVMVALLPLVVWVARGLLRYPARRLVKNASSARSLLSGFSSRGVTHGYLYEKGGGSQSE